jgi:hypothetical protein
VWSTDTLPGHVARINCLLRALLAGIVIRYLSSAHVTRCSTHPGQRPVRLASMSAAESARGTRVPSFEPVPLPQVPRGQLTLPGIEPALREWASSPPIRALAEASAWPWPSCPDTEDLLTELARLSGDWDFRGMGGRIERNIIGPAQATVGERVIPDDLVAAAAQALGLVSATPIPATRFTWVTVLSGLVRGCVNRTAYAAEIRRAADLTAAHVAVLGAHRELSPDEVSWAAEQGLGTVSDEAEVVLAATRRAFHLSDPLEREGSQPESSGWSNDHWAASARYGWPEVEVLIVPSNDSSRRANTEDQLRYWASRAEINPVDQVLLVTTQVYVPFQYLTALRILGLEYGCGVYCCGVDLTTALVPFIKLSARSYLQEIRAALLAAHQLITAASRSSR